MHLTRQPDSGLVHDKSVDWMLSLRSTRTNSQLSLKNQSKVSDPPSVYFKSLG